MTGAGAETERGSGKLEGLPSLWAKVQNIFRKLPILLLTIITVTICGLHSLLLLFLGVVVIRLGFLLHSGDDLTRSTSLKILCH